MPAQPLRLLGSAKAPDGVEIRDHPRSEEDRLAAREPGVIHLAAPQQVVLQLPGKRDLGVSLDVARLDRVAPPADSHVERRPRPPRIGQARGETDLLDEAFRVEGGLNLPLPFATPAPVAILLDIL